MIIRPKIWQIERKFLIKLDIWVHLYFLILLIDDHVSASDSGSPLSSWIFCASLISNPLLIAKMRISAAALVSICLIYIFFGLIFLLYWPQRYFQMQKNHLKLSIRLDCKGKISFNTICYKTTIRSAHFGYNFPKWDHCFRLWTPGFDYTVIGSRFRSSILNHCG